VNSCSSLRRCNSFLPPPVFYHEELKSNRGDLNFLHRFEESSSRTMAADYWTFGFFRRRKTHAAARCPQRINRYVRGAHNGVRRLNPFPTKWLVKILASTNCGIALLGSQPVNWICTLNIAAGTVRGEEKNARIRIRGVPGHWEKERSIVSMSCIRLEREVWRSIAIVNANTVVVRRQLPGRSSNWAEFIWNSFRLDGHYFQYRARR